MATSADKRIHLSQSSWYGHIPIERHDDGLWCLLYQWKLWEHEEVPEILRSNFKPNFQRLSEGEPFDTWVRFEAMETYLMGLIADIDKKPCEPLDVTDIQPWLQNVKRVHASQNLSVPKILGKRLPAPAPRVPVSDWVKNFEELDYSPFPYDPNKNWDTPVRTDWENRLGQSLPQDYLSFLEKYPHTGDFYINAGVCVWGIEPLSAKHDGRYPITRLFAACTDKRFDLIEIAKGSSKELGIPPHLLQIGQDYDDNFFCLDLSPDNFGKVYLWKREHAMNEASLYLIANDFLSFLKHVDLYL